MSIARFVSLGRFSALTEGRAQLVVAHDGRRLACVRLGASVAVLDDRCPHQGHPLSAGIVRDGVLTCQWHNWKFELATGACVFGGESVRRYACEVTRDEVFVELAEDPAYERERTAVDFRAAVLRGALDGVVRNGLRLARVAGQPDAPVLELVAMLCSRAPYGVGDAIVAAAAAVALREESVLDAAEALAVAGVAVVHELRASESVPLPAPIPGSLAEVEAFLLDLLEERPESAVARVLGLPREVPPQHVLTAWLLPFASLKLLDRGASLVRLNAVRTLLDRLDDLAARALLASLTRSLGAAVAESDLPPWRATRQALLDARAVVAAAAQLVDPPALAAALRAGEAAATAASLHAMRQGAAPSAVLNACANVALEQLANYDTEHSRRAGKAIVALDAARGVVFVCAALALQGGRFDVAHAVLAAGLVGRLHRYDTASPLPTTSVASGTLFDALVRRDGTSARSLILEMEPPELVSAMRVLVRYAALEARGDGPHAGAAATLGHVGWLLFKRDPRSARGVALALVRALVDDPIPGLTRLAATATRFVQRGDPPDTD